MARMSKHQLPAIEQERMIVSWKSRKAFLDRHLTKNVCVMALSSVRSAMSKPGVPTFIPPTRPTKPERKRRKQIPARIGIDHCCDQIRHKMAQMK